MTVEAVKKYVEYLQEKEKYGVNPVTALDYSSLYPSLIMAYNLSPEYLITDYNYKEQMKEKYDIHDIDFVYNYEDFEGNANSKNIRGWTVRHNNDHKFGLYPEILSDLFRQRAEMKKSLIIYKEKKEHMEKEYSDRPLELQNSREFQECLFQLKYCDTKQKALKVYMNCFYGELGNKNSPLFILELAGGITSAGQMNLKKVKKYIEDRECKIYYGDTDSLYFTFSDESFLDIHRNYLTTNTLNDSVKSTKEEYCSQLVQRTFKLVKSMAVEVNKFLLNDNGTKYLKMAYEEVLYPVVFLARKKYYGIAHEGIVNFKPKDLFIRGLEVKKRGVSELLRIVCLDTMWDSMNIYNILTLRELVFNKVDFLFNKEWEMEDFTQTALWKPNKKNQTLITYVRRMLADERDPPNPFERFNYVIVKITDPCRLYDFKGRKIDIKKGDKMEYIEYAKANNLEIDLNYYFEKQLIGQFARLISYDEEFHSFKIINTGSEFLEENEFEILDDKTMNNCRKYIKEYAKKYTGLEKIGEVYKKVYRTINSLVNENRKQLCGNKKKLTVMFNYQDELGSERDVRQIIMEKVGVFINMDVIKKSITKEVKNSYETMKSKDVKITNLFNKGKNSFLNKLIDNHDKNLEKTVMEFIKFTRDVKIDNIIFNTGEQNISPIMKKIQLENNIIHEMDDKNLEEKIKELYEKNSGTVGNDNAELLEQAYNKFINIVSIVKSKKIAEGIMELNVKTVEKSVRKDYSKAIEGFRL
jgi:hypothetical protein